ncbi:MAG: YggS family pyridoxal phosphate-dependent enzyme [Candidatus Omnitrophica bacterium]|nr:YggS family pyridoxal phosphate-dependent enzyme [Candidatus Omnitrophota bacterium]
MIQDNLKQVLSSIQEICTRAGRDPNDVVLVGVTKFAEAPAINDAIAVGLLHIAENKVQLAEAKFPKLDLGGKLVMKHMIGHLQSNKAKDAVRIFDLIQSVDSLKLAQEINKRAAMISKVQDILIQVDIAQEEQKFGLSQEELDAFMAGVKDMKNVSVLGLMTMAPLTEDKARIRSVFRRGKEIFEHFKSKSGPGTQLEMKYLSMGMSGDYEIALEEGANMVRIGSAIFK